MFIRIVDPGRKKVNWLNFAVIDSVPTWSVSFANLKKSAGSLQSCRLRAKSQAFFLTPEKHCKMIAIATKRVRNGWIDTGCEKEKIPGNFVSKPGWKRCRIGDNNNGASREGPLPFYHTHTYLAFIRGIIWPLTTPGPLKP